ncbi:Uncharacterised protein [Candidatus Gugararchaeum adminiculabundum]|nr:Uncharacterised protein [Candidatus Gugararchaeum adminiculabundum]
MVDKRLNLAKPAAPPILLALIALPLIQIILSVLKLNIPSADWFSGGVIMLICGAFSVVFSFYFAGAFLRSGLTRLHLISLGFLSLTLSLTIVSYDNTIYGAGVLPYTSYVYLFGMCISGILFLMSGFADLKIEGNLKKNLITTSIFFIFLTTLILAIVLKTWLDNLPPLFAGGMFTQSNQQLIAIPAVLYFLTALKYYTSIYRKEPNTVIFWFSLGFAATSAMLVSMVIPSSQGDVWYTRIWMLLTSLLFLKGLLESKEF